ncbi:MAG: DUF6569 family protein, partial [Polyangiaceae bacterium]
LAVGAQTIVPLLRVVQAPRGASKATLLGEALAKGEATVTEVCLDGSVNEVRVRHAGKELLLLLDGDQLLGARQNRVFNASFLVMPGSDVVLPVSCVERGRWAYQGGEGDAAARHGGPADPQYGHDGPGDGDGGDGDGGAMAFSASNVTATMMIRSQKMRRVTTSVRQGRGYDADQRAVWTDVDNYLKKSGVYSTTAALQDGIDSRRAAADRALIQIPAQPTQIGMALVVDGALVAMDLFGSPELYASSHEKIVRGILTGIDSSGPARGDARQVVSDVITRLGRAKASRRPAPGCGDTLHGELDELAFAAVVHEGEAYHAMVAGA